MSILLVLVILVILAGACILAVSWNRSGEEAQVSRFLGMMIIIFGILFIRVVLKFHFLSK